MNIALFLWCQVWRGHLLALLVASQSQLIICGNLLRTNPSIWSPRLHQRVRTKHIDI